MEGKGKSFSLSAGEELNIRYDDKILSFNILIYIIYSLHLSLTYMSVQGGGMVNASN